MSDAEHQGETGPETGNETANEKAARLGVDPDEGGQVSATDEASMDPADSETPIAPDQAVAGYPDSESGSPQEGAAGPNSRPNENEAADRS